MLAPLADPLRVLRAVRFASRLGFELEETLVDAAADNEVSETFLPFFLGSSAKSGATCHTSHPSVWAFMAPMDYAAPTVVAV